MRRAVPFTLLLGFATLAGADDGVRRETVTLGQAVSRDVGFAIGVACDHPDIVGAAMTTAPSGKTNVLTLTGKRVGKTLCRAGLDPNRPSIVFEVTVVATARPPRS